jgi:outer membrane immunogenic protein
MISQEQIIGVVAAGAAVTAMTADSASADITDFAGPYAGLGFGTMAGEVGDDYVYALGSALAFSGFGGYNWVNGNTLMGVELGFWSNDIYYGGGDADYGIEGIIDLRGRVGMAIGENSMLYGAAGLWQGDYLFEFDDHGGSAFGFSVGIGFETNLSNNMFIGGDLTMRSTTSVDLNDPTDDDKSPDTVTTASVRVGFRF